MSDERLGRGDSHGDESTAGPTLRPVDTASEVVDEPPARVSSTPDGAALLLRALAGAVSGDALAAAVRHTIVADRRATWVALHVVDRDRHAVDLVGSDGFPDDLIGMATTVPLSAALPVTDAITRGTLVVAPLATLAEDYPLAHAYVGTDEPALRTLVVVPAVSAGAAVAAVVLELVEPPEPTWAAWRRLEAAADALAVWTRCADDAHPSAGRRSRAALWLTERQRSVLAMVRNGLTNAQIARELDYSTATVKADLAAMYRLFGVRDRGELVARAARSGW